MKKRYKLSVLFLATAVFIGCSSSSQSNKEDTDTTSLEETAYEEEDTGAENRPTDTEQENTNSFDINTAPISDADIGDFPFFSFPEGLKATNKPIERKYDIIYFPIGGKMTPLEGKVFKTYVSVTNRGDDDWSLPYFLKSYDDAILSAGGVKIFDGKISNEEYTRYKEDATYLGEDGSIGYTGENIKVYIIRRADGKNIYIQLTGNTAGGKLNILQEEGFVQTITKITSDEIVKDLNEKGKSILYINFDVDKADIKSDGEEVVGQIAQALQQDGALKIAIEGHTDNTGDAVHNKKLSADRANAVMQSLVNSGIDKSRLTAQGFGAEKPLVANDSDENKAKNRRVELVKK